MENNGMYLHTFSERENGSILEEPFDEKNLSKMNLCNEGLGRKKKLSGTCSQLGSVAALKYAVVGLYLLVFLILVGVFILAGKILEIYLRNGMMVRGNFLFFPEPKLAAREPEQSSYIFLALSLEAF
nr:PREDICTED: scavenger receptor class A member 5 [Anolis carolinensis]|eukprot:XP_003228841.3 PREDICTED: scavenger receptor class A member 5 [Anolis carolinensis]